MTLLFTLDTISTKTYIHKLFINLLFFKSSPLKRKSFTDKTLRISIKHCFLQKNGKKILKLTHFKPMFHFYTPWKRQKNRVHNNYRKSEYFFDDVSTNCYTNWGYPNKKHLSGYQKDFLKCSHFGSLLSQVRSPYMNLTIPDSDVYRDF